MTRAIAARWQAIVGRLVEFVCGVARAARVVGLRPLGAAELSTRLSAVGPHEIEGADDIAVITPGGVVGSAAWSRVRPPHSLGPALRCRRSLGAGAGGAAVPQVAPQAGEESVGLAGRPELRSWHGQGLSPSRDALGAANVGGAPGTMLRLSRTGCSQSRAGRAAWAAALGPPETSFTKIRVCRRGVARKLASLR